MLSLSWLRKPNRSGPVERRRSQTTSRKRATFRPQLQTLEDRWMPSTLTVTTAADNATNPIPGSLRYEVQIAQSGDTIVFKHNLKGQTIALNNAQIEVTQDLTIQGLGAANLAISGQNASRVFQVDSGFQVTIAGLTIENGNVPGGDGGGILNMESNVLTVSGCTLSGNTAYDGGGIENYGSSFMTVSNCTVSGNSAADFGGGIDNFGVVTLSNSSVTGNSASRGAGILNSWNVTIDKSVVCNNFDTGGLGEDDLFSYRLVTITNSQVCVIYYGSGFVNGASGTLAIDDSTLLNAVAPSRAVAPSPLPAGVSIGQPLSHTARAALITAIDGVFAANGLDASAAETWALGPWSDGSAMLV